LRHHAHVRQFGQLDGRAEAGLQVQNRRKRFEKEFLRQWLGFQDRSKLYVQRHQFAPAEHEQEHDQGKDRAGEALGDTSIFEGVAWAWRTLSPNLPFADGRAYNAEDNTKILVLLTDGNNNWLQLSNPNRSLHAAQAYYVNQRLGSTQNMSQTQANTHLDNTTNTVCTNAKAKGVTIYAVVFSLEGTPIPASWKDLVIACASVENGEAQAFFAEGANQLKEVFQVIAGRISKLYISQ
jgi:hypothetical protein